MTKKYIEKTTSSIEYHEEKTGKVVVVKKEPCVFLRYIYSMSILSSYFTIIAHVYILYINICIVHLYFHRH
jgi:hypothetical protein